jgi:tRNA(Ser,Leu) C12 N-acetylase TAN1
MMVVFCASCGKGRERECEKQIKEEIHVGVSVESAEAALKKCGFKTSVDLSKHLLYDDKLVAGSVVSERTQATVDFDSDKKVAAVTVSKGLIGP